MVADIKTIREYYRAPRSSSSVQLPPENHNVRNLCIVFGGLALIALWLVPSFMLMTAREKELCNRWGGAWIAQTSECELNGRRFTVRP
jgi:hypothetical protein